LTFQASCPHRPALLDWSAFLLFSLFLPPTRPSSPFTFTIESFSFAAMSSMLCATRRVAVAARSTALRRPAAPQMIAKRNMSSEGGVHDAWPKNEQERRRLYIHGGVWLGLCALLALKIRGPGSAEPKKEEAKQ